MAKDPAFLFYTSDFLTGTMFMNHEQKGKYITLLCIQHQNKGVIDKDIFNKICDHDLAVSKKFIQNEFGFYNERLQEEIEKRKVHSDHQRQNVMKRWKKTNDGNTTVIPPYKNGIGLVIPLEDENENENISDNKDLIKYAENFKKQLLADQYALESSAMNNGLSPIDIAPAVEMFFSTKIATGEASEWKTYKEAKRNFIYWLKFYKDLKPKQNGKENSIGRITESDAQKFLTEIERRDQRGDFNRNQI